MEAAVVAVGRAIRQDVVRVEVARETREAGLERRRPGEQVAARVLCQPPQSLDAAVAGVLGSVGLSCRWRRREGIDRRIGPVDHPHHTLQVPRDVAAAAAPLEAVADEHDRGLALAVLRQHVANGPQRRRDDLGPRPADRLGRLCQVVALERGPRRVIALASLEAGDGAANRVAIVGRLDGGQRVQWLDDHRAVAGTQPAVDETKDAVANRGAVGWRRVELVEQERNGPGPAGCARTYSAPSSVCGRPSSSSSKSVGLRLRSSCPRRSVTTAVTRTGPSGLLPSSAPGLAEIGATVTAARAIAHTRRRRARGRVV